MNIKQELEDILIKIDQLHRKYNYIAKTNNNIVSKYYIENETLKSCGLEKYTEEDFKKLQEQWGVLFKNMTLEKLNKISCNLHMKKNNKNMPIK